MHVGPSWGCHLKRLTRVFAPDVVRRRMVLVIMYSAATNWAFMFAIRNELANLCGDLNLRMEVEKGPDGSLLRPYALVHRLVDEPLAVEVGVLHTLQSSILLAVVQPGQLAKTMERRKILGRQALCKRIGWSFSPFAAETIGVMRRQDKQFAAEAGHCVGQQL